MLNKFKAAKAYEISELHKKFEEGMIPAVHEGERPSFSGNIKAMGPGAIIAEYKPASPSAGILRENLNPLDFAEYYAKNGAAAISVLTEHEYFKGSPDLLFFMNQHDIPLLRKDFIFDPLQVAMTASSPASAVLLIVRICDDVNHLMQLHEIAKMTGLEPVVEVFDEADLAQAREVGAEIIQVNNRDLDTLEIDLDKARNMVKDKKDNELWICASGVDSRELVVEMGELGYGAILIGTCLMTAEDPSAKLRELAGK